MLKKTVNLTPYDAEPANASDVIYGGLGNEFLHGGAGDNAISGAEALTHYYAAPSNNGDELGYGRTRAGEFAAYDEYDP